MKMMAILKIFLLAGVLAVVGRYGYLSFESWQNEWRTAELCAAVGNYLETGNLREAFEGLEYGASRTGSKKVCISIIDNGRSFAPNCMDSSMNYQAVTCKAEANVGVRALVMYPRDDLFGRKLFILCGFIAALLTLMLYLSQKVVSYLSSQIMNELRLRLLGESSDKEKRISGRVAEWILSRTGIWQLVKHQAEDFEQKIKIYEERLVSESALRAQKEAEAVKTKTYIKKIRNIRHDIRSPLSGLLAIQEVLDSTDALLYSTCSSVVRGLRSLVEKLNNLEDEELTPRLTIVEVVAEQAVQAVRFKFLKRKNISISLHFNTEQLTPVFAIPDTLNRIFENLFENAFDAVSLDGLINAFISADNTQCRIVIEDNGCGIAPELASRLFREGTTYGKVGGTGLGLYHSKKSLEAWSGKISYEPKSGGGTRFTITLPIAQTGILYKSHPGTNQVIVVDDDPNIPVVLKRAGFTVLAAATDYETGRKLLADKKFGNIAALVDHDLGNGKLGTDLVVEIPGPRMVFLCTHDYDNPNIVQMAKQAGVSIIPKPLLVMPGAKQEMGVLNRSTDEFEPIPMHL